MQVTLGEICSFTNGGTPKKSVPEYWTGDIPFITGADIDEENGTITEPRGYITEEAISKSATNLIPTESILLVTRTGVGKVAIPPYPVCVSQDFTALSFDHKVVHQRYLFHVLRWAKESFVLQARGATIRGITREVVSNFKFELPDYPEQERIADILDKADEIKQSSETSKEMREQVIRSVFLELFGDPVNLETKWQRMPFGGLMECKNRIRVPVKKSERETTEGTYPYYGASGIVDYVDSYLFEGEHLLISEDGANLVARVTPIAFIATGQFWVNNHAHVFAENGNLDVKYCETLFSLLDLSTHITGSAQPKLNKGNLDKIVIPVPPLEIQRRFRQIVKNISKIGDQVDARNSALMDNSNSLVQDLLS